MSNVKDSTLGVSIAVMHKLNVKYQESYLLEIERYRLQ
jgi:hypothetical protein